jgi:hypothetical protein
MTELMTEKKKEFLAALALVDISPLDIAKIMCEHIDLRQTMNKLDAPTDDQQRQLNAARLIYHLTRED